jgi:hypothetical protein
MKKIFAIAWKDAIIRFASSSELLFFIILPVVFTFILAGGTPSGNEDNRIRLLVVDESQTEISKQIIDELENSTAVRPEVVEREEAQSQFDGRRASAVFIIPSGINIESLQSGSAEVELLQQPNNLNASIAERAVLTAIRRVSSAISAAQNAVTQREAKQPFASDAEKQTYFRDFAGTGAEHPSRRARTRDRHRRDQRLTRLNMTRAPIRPRGNSSRGCSFRCLASRHCSPTNASKGRLRRLLTTPITQSDLFAWHDLRSGGDGACANVTIGRVWNFGDETRLGTRTAGIVRHPAGIRAGGGGVRHHDGHVRQDRRSSQRIERHVRHGLCPNGRMLVSAGVVPVRDTKCCENTPHHMGNAGHVGSRPTRQRINGYIARSRSPAWVCSNLLHIGRDEISLRVRKSFSDWGRHKSRMKRINRSRTDAGLFDQSSTSNAFAILPCNCPAHRATFINVVHNRKLPRMNNG